jgi:hypothetical protein
VSSLTILDFLNHPELLGTFHVGSSWDRWKACLKAAYALPMSPAEHELFAEVAGNRAPPTKPVDELVAVAGRGGAKSTIAADIAICVAVNVDHGRLRPGEKATILCLAVDRDQAQIVCNISAPILLGYRCLNRDRENNRRHYRYY